jgi:DNA-binding XRE family transcriptional regulator
MGSGPAAAFPEDEQERSPCQYPPTWSRLNGEGASEATRLEADVTGTKRSSSKRRKGEPSANGQRASGTPTAGRRFTPAMRSVTEGGNVYGNLIANERRRRGLSQKELAAGIRTSPATIARIEEGHPPSTELRRRLAKALAAEPRHGLMGRLTSRRLWRAHSRRS